MGRRFFITEVFSEGPYQGNQLATLPQAAGIDPVEMQKIARAFNFSETTFILGGDLESGFDVRIFTPNKELPFAGHPTLGTAYLILQEILKTDADAITLNLGVGPIRVRRTDDGLLWMRQNQPVFGESVERERVAASLGLEVDDVLADFPCQFVSTGLEFLLVPLRSLATLKAAAPQGDSVARGLFLFCPEGYERDQAIAARMLAREYGITEDPATGSANGCLAAYLLQHDFMGPGDIDIRVGQGYEVARPSQLHLRASRDDAGFRIDVGGRVRVVAEGEWQLEA